MPSHGYTGAQDGLDVNDALLLLDRAHDYLDEHPETYPPRRQPPILEGRPL